MLLYLWTKKRNKQKGVQILNFLKFLNKMYKNYDYLINFNEFFSFFPPFFLGFAPLPKTRANILAIPLSNRMHLYGVDISYLGDSKIIEIFQ